MTTSAEFFSTVSAPAAAPTPPPAPVPIPHPYAYLPKLPAAHSMPTLMDSLFDPLPAIKHEPHPTTSAVSAALITSPTHVIDTNINTNNTNMFMADPLPPPMHHVLHPQPQHLQPQHVQPQHVLQPQAPQGLYADAIDNAIAFTNDASSATTMPTTTATKQGGGIPSTTTTTPVGGIGMGGSELVWCEGCEICGKRFFKQGSLIRHIRAAHRRRNKYINNNGISKSNSNSNTNGCERLFCPKCPKTFSQQGSLNRHLRSIHEARKLHCRYCSLAFGQAFDLKRHQRRKHPHDAPCIPRRALPVYVRTTN